MRMVQVLPAAVLRAAGNLQHSQQPSLAAMLSTHISEALALCQPNKASFHELCTRLLVSFWDLYPLPSTRVSTDESLTLVGGLQGGCGWKGKATTQLSGSPTMCVVALAWSGAAMQVDVVAVCSAIPLKLDLKQAFPGLTLS